MLLYYFKFQPAASGSGVPAVIAYLNGVKMPHVVEFKVLVVRVFSTIATVVAALAGGKVNIIHHYFFKVAEIIVLLKFLYNSLCNTTIS